MSGDVFETQARRMAHTTDPAAPLLRHVLALLDSARAEVAACEASALEGERRRFLGGLWLYSDPERADGSRDGWAAEHQELDGGHERGGAA